MTLNRCVLDSVVNLDFIGLFSAMLQEAFHSILRFFSYIKIKHLIEPVSKWRIKAWRSPTIREILGIVISWTKTPPSAIALSWQTLKSNGFIQCCYNYNCSHGNDFPSFERQWFRSSPLHAGLVTFSIGVWGKEKRRTFTSTGFSFSLEEEVHQSA